jgi:hypothetical protein
MKIPDHGRCIEKCSPLQIWTCLSSANDRCRPIETHDSVTYSRRGPSPAV